MQRPSDLYTPFHFKSSLMAQALWNGNAYAHIYRDDFGVPIELVLLPPTRTIPVLDDGKLFYLLTLKDGEKVKILPENIIHAKGLCDDGITGISIITVLREALSVGLAAQRYAGKFYENDASPGLILLTTDKKMDAENKEKFRNEWNKLHLGVKNSHRMGILDAGLQATILSNNHEETQFLETRQFEAGLIAATVFGVPPNMVGQKGADSYNSLEQENRNFLQNVLDPWMVMLEQEFNNKLLSTVQEVRNSHFFEFDRRSLEATDTKSMSEALVMDVNNGIMSLNECRQYKGLPPDPNEEADKLRKPVNIGYIDDPVQNTITTFTPGLDAEPTEPGASVGDKEASTSVEPGLRSIKLNDETLKELIDELNAVLPEQRAAVYQRYNGEI